MMRPVRSWAKTNASRNAEPSPTNSTGQPHVVSGVPNPRAKKMLMPTASSPPQMLSGAKAATFSGHSTAMS